jgi:hypothetical protein
MAEGKEIADGQRAVSVLKDDVVQRAFNALEAKYIDAWRRADNPQSREEAWAKLRALDELRVELQIIADAGIRATATRERRERTSSRPPGTT